MLINFLNQNKLDLFFTVLSDLFVNILENGLASVEIGTVKFESSLTTHAFALGFNCIQDGMHPYIIQAILESQILVLLKNEDISDNELFELKLLEKIMMTFQEKDYVKFLNFQNRLCSMQTYCVNEMKFEKFKK